jgi:hypothetical protein
MARAVRQMTYTEVARRFTAKLGRRIEITTVAHWEAGSMVIPKDVTLECFDA